MVEQTIAVETLPVVAYQDVPVLTTELLATLYGTKPTNISTNFLSNAERFELGKHYFKLEGEELKEFKRLHRSSETASVEISPRVNALTLWTERGAARHAKILDTDQAWDVFEKLENTYFDPREATPATKDPIISALIHGLMEIDALKTKLTNLSHSTRVIRDVTKKVTKSLHQRIERLEEVAATQIKDPAPITRGSPHRPFRYRKGMMTPTELGKHFDLTARQITSSLVQLGLVNDVTPRRAKRRVYELTSLGRAYGAPIHTNGDLISESSTSNGAKRARTILWMPEVLSVIAEHLETVWKS